MRKKSALLIVAFISILFPVYSWLCWTIVIQTYRELSQAEKREKFLGYFPAVIDEINTITLINMVCLLVAMLFSFFAARHNSGATRGLSIFVFVVAGILTVLTLLAASV